jgi:hypothetical protein
MPTSNYGLGTGKIAESDVQAIHLDDGRLVASGEDRRGIPFISSGDP